MLALHTTVMSRDSRCPHVVSSLGSYSRLQPLTRCRKVFQSLINIAVEELCEISRSLIDPVCMGVARPTAPFSLFNRTDEALTVRVCVCVCACACVCVCVLSEVGAGGVSVCVCVGMAKYA